MSPYLSEPYLVVSLFKDYDSISVMPKKVNGNSATISDCWISSVCVCVCVCVCVFVSVHMCVRVFQEHFSARRRMGPIFPLRTGTLSTRRTENTNEKKNSLTLFYEPIIGATETQLVALLLLASVEDFLSQDEHLCRYIKKQDRELMPYEIALKSIWNNIRTSYNLGSTAIVWMCC